MVAIIIYMYMYMYVISYRLHLRRPTVLWDMMLFGEGNIAVRHVSVTGACSASQAIVSPQENFSRFSNEAFFWRGLFLSLTIVFL